MKSSILLPVDGSTLSAQALPLAQTLAEQFGLTLHIVRVHEPPNPTWIDNLPLVDEAEDATIRQQEQRNLDKLVEANSAHGKPMVTTNALLDGSILPALLREIERTQPAFVVMMTHGRSGVARIWLGSVADQLIRRSPVPVLLERPEVLHTHSRPTPLRHILIPLDGLPASAAVLHDVVTTFEPQTCTYTLLRVIEAHAPIGYGPMAYGQSLPYGITPELITEAQQYMTDVAALLRAQGLTVQTEVVASGISAAGAIRDAATKYQIDMIALATHGRSGIARAVVGSTADHILRTASVPVLMYGPAVAHLDQHPDSILSPGTMVEH